MSDAVKLARQVLDRWELDPEDYAVLARAVIEQAAEIEKLKAALGEALDEWQAWRNDSGKCQSGSDTRLVELRRLL